MNSVPQKQCTKCKQFYDATTEYFGSLKKSKDGLSYHCKLCNAAYQREYCSNHREESRAKVKRHRDKFPEKKRVSDFKRYWSDPEKQRQRIREMRKRPEVKIREKKSRDEWGKKNHNKIIFKAKIYRHLKRSSEGVYTQQDIETLYSNQGGKCAYCHEKLNNKYHIDHIYPLSRGGSNWPYNLALACPKCNISKSNFLLDEWEKVRGW